jgi:AraC family transcriptional regulator
MDVVDSVVEISPPHIVKRRTATYPGMAAEIVETTRCDRMESRFGAPVHLLVVYEHGMRHKGATFVEGLPTSTLRDFRQKLIFVPAGHEYHDWQEPRALTRVVYFYFDPAGLAINSDLGSANISFALRLFFEHSGLWETAIKLATLIESSDLEHWLYAEALSVVMAQELVQLNSGRFSVQPYARGGLGAWQQREVVVYIEDHLGEPISLATLAQLARLSSYHFCRAFNKSIGMPPHRYHTNRRIERAKALLEKPAVSVTDVGLALGFTEVSSFTAAFRKTTGLTPSSYRRSIG